MRPVDRLLNEADHRQQLLKELGALARLREVLAGRNGFEDVVRKRLGVGDRGLPTGAVRPDHFVRVLAGEGHHIEVDRRPLQGIARPFLGLPGELVLVQQSRMGGCRIRPHRSRRLRLLEGTEGGLDAGGVRVHGEQDLGLEALQRTDLPFGQGGAHRRDHVRDAVLVSSDDVHVAFDDDDALLPADRLFRSVQRVEQAALVKRRRLGSVDVLCAPGVRCLSLGRRQGASAEADDPPALVADGEHEPAAKTVVPAAVALHQQAGRQQLLLGETPLCKVGFEGIPALRAEAQLERFDGLRVQSTRDEVSPRGLRRRRVAQGVIEVARRGLVGLEQPLMPFVVLGIPALRQAHPGSLGEYAERLAEVDPFALHDEVEHIAPRAAGAEAVPGLALGRDGERGGLLTVEGAESFVATPGLLECNVLAQQVYDVDAAFHLVDDAHPCSPPITVRPLARLRMFAPLAGCAAAGSERRASPHAPRLSVASPATACSTQ